jgi:hypothetical protein
MINVIAKPDYAIRAVSFEKRGSLVKLSLRNNRLVRIRDLDDLGWIILDIAIPFPLAIFSLILCIVTPLIPD